MSVLGDLKTIYHLTTSPIRGETHKERLESFYSAQAKGYDDFRKRLLRGREELFAEVGAQLESGAYWIDFGAGTGSSVEFMLPYLPKFKHIELADLSNSLLARADEKIQENQWDNISTRVCDVSKPFGEAGRADLVTFSYSLTMIPDWFSALETALTALKPGGTIAVVDFYTSRKYPANGSKRHNWFTRTFWPIWFASDNVYLSNDHIPFLCSRFELVHLTEKRARVPYIPLIQVPYYGFIGRKPA